MMPIFEEHGNVLCVPAQTQSTYRLQLGVWSRCCLKKVKPKHTTTKLRAFPLGEDHFVGKHHTGHDTPSFETNINVPSH